MINEDKENPPQDQKVKSRKYENTPKEVISNTARFNKQFLDSKLGGNPATVSVGRMLTVMSEQDLGGRSVNSGHSIPRIEYMSTSPSF